MKDISWPVMSQISVMAENTSVFIMLLHCSSNAMLLTVLAGEPHCSSNAVLLSVKHWSLSGGGLDGFRNT